MDADERRWSLGKRRLRRLELDRDLRPSASICGSWSAAFICVLCMACICGTACDDDPVIPGPTNLDQGRTDVPASDVDGGSEGDGGDVSGDDVVDAPVDAPVDLPADVVDETPRVVNAFSQDGEDVVVRFSEEMDATTTAVAGNYRIIGSDNSEIGVLAATLDGRFAFLELDLTADPINPDLTYEVLVSNATDRTGNLIDSRNNRVRVNRSLYLAIIWHQHQPSYHDPNRDVLIGPWVRKHATKDYWDMTAILRQYEDIHLTVNLTSSLLFQNQFYIDRLGPFLDPEENTIDEAAFLAEWEGRTDPFVDLLLNDTPTRATATEAEIGLFYADPWATVSTSDPIMQRFPEYVALRDQARDTYDQLEFALLKVFFEIAWFDPDFLNGPVTLTNGWVVDLTDVVDRQGDGTYRLNAFYGDDAPDEVTRIQRLELLANRLLAENVKIMTDVVPLHQDLLYDPETREGRVEVVTTPFFHPILPLLVDSDLARHAQPTDLLPSPPFQFAEDAFAQVAMARAYYEETFGQPLYGMWPGEGSVAEEIVGILADNDIEWVATDQRVLERSTPSGQRHWFPYQVDADSVTGSGGDTDDAVAIVFRDGPLSDNIGFAYQTLPGTVAAEDFMRNVLAQAPRFGEPDRLLTVILDGENAWELYRIEHDGKGFLHAMYTSLEESQAVGELITVTPAEYIHGNLDRSVAPHPIAEQRELEPLWRGSWIDASYATWIGESEENLAWTYLLRARTELEQSGIPRPNPLAPAPDESDALQWTAWAAWREMYAAEGSDWFWWYGQDQTSASNDDTPFDRAFRSHLTGMYEFLNQALAVREHDPIEVPDFGPIIQPRATSLRGPFDPAPSLDGRFLPDETEWSSTAGSFYDNDSSGAIASRNDDIGQVFFGYDRDDDPGAERLYLGLVFNEDLSEKLESDYLVAIYMNHKHILNPDLGTFEPDPPVVNTESPDGVPLNFVAGGASWMLEIDFSGATPAVALLAANGDGGWDAASSTGIVVAGPTSGGRILELGIPWESLGMAFGDPFEFLVVASEGDTPVDQAPQLESQVVFDDVTNLVLAVFEVDVSGELDTYVDIANPPPPSGSGTVFITGNQDQWGNWYPNFYAMRDDGEGADREAGDRIWTRSFAFRPGLLLRWKYTIGLPADEGRWSGTEEFPLTERGYTLPNAPTTVVISDIFADRPNPTGTLGPNTEVDVGD